MDCWPFPGRSKTGPLTAQRACTRVAGRMTTTRTGEKMTARVRVKRDDYEKFRVASLGLSIRENPGRSYSIDESAWIKNPYHGYREHSREQLPQKKKILIYSSLEKDGTPVVCFIHGDLEYRVSMMFSATNSVLGRMFSDDISEVANLSPSPREARIRQADLDYAKSYFQKYGSVIERRTKHNTDSYHKLLTAILH